MAAPSVVVGRPGGSIARRPPAAAGSGRRRYAAVALSRTASRTRPPYLPKGPSGGRAPTVWGQGPGVPLLRAAAADDGRAAYDEVEATAAAVQPTRRRSSFDALFKELGEVMRFSLPAVGIFLVNPLMTLVDTAFLGGTAVGQAALQPSGAVLDYPTILLSFLAVGNAAWPPSNAWEFFIRVFICWVAYEPGGTWPRKTADGDLPSSTPATPATPCS